MNLIDLLLCSTCNAFMRPTIWCGGMGHQTMDLSCEHCGGEVKCRSDDGGKTWGMDYNLPKPKHIAARDMRAAVQRLKESQEWARLKQHELAHVAELEARIA